jgi:acyl-lipid omega-6 desaturase (Delta-12 desaturase)
MKKELQSFDQKNNKTLSQRLVFYCESQNGRALFELAVTLVPLLLLWVLMWMSVKVGFWLPLLLAIPTGGFLMRLFVIQHDCGHGSFFSSRLANDWLGRLLGAFTLTPYDYWKRNHSIHHSTSSNLDRRGIGDIHTATVEEYRQMSWWGRFAYRLYRHPLVMFGVGPAYVFFFQHRLPLNQITEGWKPWLSTMTTNALIFLAATLLIWYLGLWGFVLVHVSVVLVAASIGVWLFYVQHQYEEVMWMRDHDWTLQGSALVGSSHYDLPLVLRWFTANIGVHHVHHMNSRIPYYRLHQVLRDNPELRDVGRLTLFESFRTIHLALWDEAKKKLITFREFTRMDRA